MKNTARYSFLLSVIVLLACQREPDTTEVAGTEEPSVPVSEALPGESLEEVGLKPLGEGAERYLGEFVSSENKDLRVVIRKHPTRENLLAKNAYIAGKTPGMAEFWYDDNQRQVSNRFAKIQPKFTVMKLNESGDLLTEITIDLETNTSDTTLFTRTP